MNARGWVAVGVAVVIAGGVLAASGVMPLPGLRPPPIEVVESGSDAARAAGEVTAPTPVDPFAPAIPIVESGSDAARDDKGGRFGAGGECDAAAIDQAVDEGGDAVGAVELADRGTRAADRAQALPGVGVLRLQVDQVAMISQLATGFAAGVEARLVGAALALQREQPDALAQIMGPR